MNRSTALNPELLAWLNRLGESGETGRLEASSGTANREMFFRGGSIVGVRTSVDEERLGELLIRRGRITRQHFEDASIFVRHGWRLGEILVELRILDRSEIEPSVRRQAIEVACAALADSDLEVRFDKSGDLFVTLEAPLSTVQVVMEAARRLEGTASTVATLRSDPRRFHARPGWAVSSQLPLTPEDAYLISRFQEGATLSNVMRASQLDEGCTARILLGLVSSGLLVAAEDGGSPRSRTAEDEEASFAREIARMFRKLELQDPWRALGLPRSADTRTARDAFRKAVQRYHPDRHRGLNDPDLQKKLATICHRFTDALTCLTVALRTRGSDPTESAIPLASTWVPSTRPAPPSSPGQRA